mgnify:FL=1|jgi:hypothetical protein
MIDITRISLYALCYFLGLTNGFYFMESFTAIIINAIVFLLVVILFELFTQGYSFPKLNEGGEKDV